jgi:hypothetical protein
MFALGSPSQLRCFLSLRGPHFLLRNLSRAIDSHRDLLPVTQQDLAGAGPVRRSWRLCSFAVSKANEPDFVRGWGFQSWICMPFGDTPPGGRPPCHQAVTARLWELSVPHVLFLPQYPLRKCILYPTDKVRNTCAATCLAAADGFHPMYPSTGPSSGHRSRYTKLSMVVFKILV